MAPARVNAGRAIVGFAFVTNTAGLTTTLEEEITPVAEARQFIGLGLAMALFGQDP